MGRVSVARVPRRMQSPGPMLQKLPSTGALPDHLSLRPRSRCLRLLALRRSGAQVCAGQVTVSNAPSHYIGQYADKPGAVIAGALVEAAHLFINITKQVERVHAHVGALDRPLEQRPEVFQAIGVDLPAHVLPRMINHLMLVELGEFPLAVLLRGVGI